MNQNSNISVINPEITSEWLTGYSTGKGVQVAVIDSGIDASHPALKGKVIRTCVVEKNTEGVIECLETPVEESVDHFGHGTAVAGIITDIAPDVEIINIKVLNQYNACTGDVLIEGIKWALDQDIKLINMSLATLKKQWISGLHEMCERAYAQNAIFIVSRRNIGDMGYPAMFSSVISVDREEYSDKYRVNYRPETFIEYDARGTEIEVLAPGGGTAIQTGTSFATPHVCGIVALLLQAFPDMLCIEAKAILKAFSEQQ